MATRLEKLPPSSSGGNMLSTNKNCETSSNNPNRTTTQVDNRSVALAVHDLEKILFRVRHRMNRLRREQPQLDLQSMEKALDECWEAAEGLTSFWSWFSTKQAKILREKYLALITALGATAYLDIGVTEDESNRISAFVQDIVKYLVDFAERIQWLTTGTIAGGVAVAASIAIMEWLFGMGRFLVMRAPIMAVQWIAQWFVAMGLSAGGAYAIATAIFACALVGISWIAFKVILVPIGAYFFASIAERDSQLTALHEELAKTVPLETADLLVSSIDASRVTVVSDDVHSIASTQPIIVNTAQSASSDRPQLSALDIMLLNNLFTLA